MTPAVHRDRSAHEDSSRERESEASFRAAECPPEDRLNIAYVVTRSDIIGGALVHVRSLASALMGDGHEASIICGGSQESSFINSVRALGIPCFVIPSLRRSIAPIRDLIAIHHLAQILMQIHPSLISLHSTKAGLLGRAAARLGNIPCIYTAHGWCFTEGVGFSRMVLGRVIEKCASSMAQKVITVSLFDRNLATQLRVCSAQRLVAIHNGIKDIPSTLLADTLKQPPTLLMVARFEAQKDHHTLLKALTTLKAYDWNLLLVGTGRLMKVARKQVAQLGLLERVRFLGELLDVARITSGVQVLVLSSLWEGLPRSIIEGMRASLPIVATDVGGVSELVQDGVSGYLVPRRDSFALASRIAELIQNPQMRERFGRASRQLYESHFCFDFMYRSTLHVYREVLDLYKGKLNKV